MAFIKLKTCDNSIQAHMIKNILENENIICFLTNENFTSIYPISFGLLGAGIQIMVHEDDLEKARELIKETPSSDRILCPNCQSSKISIDMGRSNLKKWSIIFFHLLLAKPIGNLLNNYYCKNCKTQFKQ